MTALELKYYFNILYDKVASASNPGYKNKEIEVFLNKAAEELLLRYYDSKEKSLIGSFESSELTRIYLDKLLREYTIQSTFTSHSGDINSTIPTTVNTVNNSDRKNGFYIKLPDDHLLTTLEEFNIVYNGSPRIVRVKPMQYDEYAIDIVNPFKKPNYRNFFWRMNYNDTVYELITDGSVVSYYTNSYIKKPLNIVLESRIITSGNIQPNTTYVVSTDSVIYNGNTYAIGEQFIGITDIDTFTTISGIVNTVITTSELPDILHKRLVEIAVRIATGTTNPELYQVKINDENSSK